MKGTPRKTSAARVSTDEVLDTNEAAAFMKLNRDTLLDGARAGTIPAGKVGGQWRFSRQKLLEMLSGAAPQKAA